jgi:hypothetical protein
MLGTRGFYVVRVARVPAGGVEGVVGAVAGTLAICVEAEGARTHLAAAAAVAALSAVAPGARAVLGVAERAALGGALGAAVKDEPSPGDAAEVLAVAEHAAAAAAAAAGLFTGADADAATPADAPRVSCLVFGGGDIAAAGGEIIAAFKELRDPALLGVRLVSGLTASHIEGLKVWSAKRKAGGAGSSREGRDGVAAAEGARDAALSTGPLFVIAVRGVGLLSGGGAGAVAAALARMALAEREGGSYEGYLLGASRDASSARCLIAATFTERDLIVPTSFDCHVGGGGGARFEHPLRRPLLPALLAPPPVLSAAAVVSRAGLAGGALEALLLRSHRAGFDLAGLVLTQPPPKILQLMRSSEVDEAGRPNGVDSAGAGAKGAGGSVAVVHLRRVDGVRKLLQVVGLLESSGVASPFEEISAGPSLVATEAIIAAVFEAGSGGTSAAKATLEASFGLGLGPKGGHTIPIAGGIGVGGGEAGGGVATGTSSLQQLGCVVLPLAPLPALASVLGALRGEGFVLVGLRTVGQTVGTLPEIVAHQLAGRCKGLGATAGAGVKVGAGAGAGVGGGFVVMAVTRDNAISRLDMMQRQARQARQATGSGGIGALSARGGAAKAALEGTAAGVFAVAHISSSPGDGCKEAAYLFETLLGQ